MQNKVLRAHYNSSVRLTTQDYVLTADYHVNHNRLGVNLNEVSLVSRELVMSVIDISGWNDDVHPQCNHFQTGRSANTVMTVTDRSIIYSDHPRLEVTYTFCMCSLLCMTCDFLSQVNLTYVVNTFGIKVV